MKNQRKKYLFFGPLPPPVHGQAMAFEMIVNSFSRKEIFLLNTEKFNYRVLNTFYSVIVSVFYLIFHRPPAVYITTSRSRMGCLKDIPLLMISGWKRLRIVNHLHGNDFLDFYMHSGVLRPLLKYAYNAVSDSVVLLEAMKFQYRDFPGMKIHVVENCYAGEFDDFAGQQVHKKRQLLFMSNLMKSKGIFEFLSAAGILLEEFGDLSVAIAGRPMGDPFMSEGLLKSSFVKIYDELKKKYPGRIIYHGLVRGEEKLKLLFESSIFVFPSFYPSEAFPISVIEAMRSGNAIVAADHNHIRLIVDRQSGILTRSKDTREVAAAVRQLLNDPVKLLAMQQYNAMNAVRNFSPGKYLDRLHKIIETHPS